LSLHFFVKLFATPQKNDNDLVVFLMFRVVMAKGRRPKKLGGDLKVQKYCFIKIDNWETKCCLIRIGS
jgi:hypothetical protein